MCIRDSTKPLQGAKFLEFRRLVMNEWAQCWIEGVCWDMWKSAHVVSGLMSRGRWRSRWENRRAQRSWWEDWWTDMNTCLRRVVCHWWKKEFTIWDPSNLFRASVTGHNGTTEMTLETWPETRAAFLRHSCSTFCSDWQAAWRDEDNGDEPLSNLVYVVRGRLCKRAIT